MNLRNASLVLAIAAVVTNIAWGQGDFFWSYSDFNSGATNSEAVGEFAPGDSGSLFLYYTTNEPSDSDVDSGSFLDIATLMADVVDYTDSEMFNADVDGEDRWAGVSGGTISSDNQFIDEMSCFALPDIVGEGVADATIGLDDLYDAGAEAFLFGRLDFVVIGKPGSSTAIGIKIGAGGIVHDGQALNPVFGNAVINVAVGEVPGDVNCDGVLNLSDVAPFVFLISNGSFSTKADINQDGAVNLLDVGPFIDLLVG